MKSYSQLEAIEKAEVLNAAVKYYKAHTPHVESLMGCEEKAFAPSGSDIFHPELWKGGHWRYMHFCYKKLLPRSLWHRLTNRLIDK